jgi:hypothetical protein
VRSWRQDCGFDAPEVQIFAVGKLAPGRLQWSGVGVLMSLSWALWCEENDNEDNSNNYTGSINHLTERLLGFSKMMQGVSALPWGKRNPLTLLVGM